MALRRVEDAGARRHNVPHSRGNKRFSSTMPVKTNFELEKGFLQHRFDAQLPVARGLKNFFG